MSKREATAVIIAVVAAFAMAMFGMTMLLAPHIEAAPTPEQQYVQEVRAVFPGESAPVPDRALIKVGMQFCQALSQGVGEATMIDVGEQSGLTAREMKAVIEAAKRHLCDE